MEEEQEYYTLKNVEEIEKYHFPHHKFSCLLVLSTATVVLSFVIVLMSAIIILNSNKLCGMRNKLPFVYVLLFLMALIFFVSVYVFKWHGKDE